MPVLKTPRHTAEQLKVLVFDLELHWTSPCSNCRHNGSNRTHRARVDALVQLIVGGWLDPARKWPKSVPKPAWLDDLTTDWAPPRQRTASGDELR